MYLAAYPWYVLYHLNMSLKKKISLSAVLGLGFVAGAIAIYKCTRIPELYNHVDYTYATTDLLIWTSIEGSFIIIAANLPTLRPIFLVATGRSLTGGSDGMQKRSNYKLSSISKGSNRPGNRKRPKDQFGIDTQNLVRDDDSVQMILPPNSIRKTYDVNVDLENAENDHTQEEHSQHIPGQAGHEPRPPQGAYMNHFGSL